MTVICNIYIDTKVIEVLEDLFFTALVTGPGGASHKHTQVGLTMILNVLTPCPANRPVPPDSHLPQQSD